MPSSFQGAAFFMNRGMEKDGLKDGLKGELKDGLKDRLKYKLKHAAGRDRGEVGRKITDCFGGWMTGKKISQTLYGSTIL